MTLVEAYFDESATHKGSPLMSLAGYLFEQRQSEIMADEWRAYLHSKGLPFLHMADCAPGNPPFDGLKSNERALIVSRMIGLIKQRTVQGIGVVLDLADFTRRFGDTCFFGSAYTVCFHHVVRGVAMWAEKTNYQGEIAYFFESGHDSAKEANYLLNLGLRIPYMREQMRYAGHAFVEKKKSPQVQAADLLAWQLTKDAKNEREGRPRRKDFANLAEHHHNIGRIMGKDLAQLEPYWENQSKEAIALFGDLAKPTMLEMGREARNKKALLRHLEKQALKGGE
jgi:hypothetical protein